MKALHRTAIIAVALFTMHPTLQAQNTSPYWSLAGNSNASASAKLGTTTQTPLYLTTNNTTRLYISPKVGWVGVGTTSPTTKLHVVGSGRFTGGLNVDEGGIHTSCVSCNGIEGYSGSSTGIGVYGSGGDGVMGYSTGSGYGVYGFSSMGIGVYGMGKDEGLHGVSYTGNGVIGEGYNYGLIGRGDANNTRSTGVYAQGAGKGLSAYGDIGVVASCATGNYAGLFYGPVFSNGGFISSDRKLKQNIQDMNNAMAIISKLQPKEYEYRQDGNYKFMNLPQGQHYGLIAQDLEQVLPTLIKDTKFETDDALPRSSNGTTTQPSQTIAFKAVNYTELIPIVVRAVQELDSVVKAKDERINQQQQQIDELRQMVLDLKNGNTNTLTLTSAYLEQNTPNPVSSTTSIRYHIPETVNSARLDFTNAKGQLVKTIALNNSTTGKVNVNIEMLTSGTYNYTLWVGGKPTDTKRLIVVR